MRSNYSYPLDSSWSQEEIVTVIDLYNAVEKAYESGIAKDEFLQKYRLFQQVVPMKMDQKNLDKEFEVQSGYSIYQVFKASRRVKNDGKVRVSNENR
ncbi:UPF0223 family protein [Companilactobacillus halodurans]|uniref:UPF0223 family protein n=1 Tax=Companilactobacillus halodurans TaxID=2584183 RepID=A0A5P0ZW19_9LACO|nr:UPF0223 family protein [Companilactobacillus halodurans]MQS74920.1 UPF0223 family protein [Companilactobacillus halodurans]MQS97209.1 UPF0223 family protein [Companilactobacillus halodurans]